VIKHALKILDLLDKKEKKHAALLFFMILLMAFLDMAGVASIMPFMAVLADPEIINRNLMLSKINSHFNFASQESFMLASGFAVIGLLIFSQVFKAITTYFQLRFIVMREFSISKSLIERYLNKPYSWHLSQNSSDLGKNILSETQYIVSNGLSPLFAILSQGAIIVAIISLLIYVDPTLAILVGLFLGVAYFSIYKLVNKKLSVMGDERVQANKERFFFVNEAFSAIKEVKIGGLEQVYLKHFQKPAFVYAKHQSSASIINQIPRFFLEAVAFGGILSLTLYLMLKDKNFSDTLPIISLYAFAGYRLMPSMQQVYGALTQIKFSGAALTTLHSGFIDMAKDESQSVAEASITYKKMISLQNISFTYPDSKTMALKDVTLEIKSNTTVGIVGKTGSGKSTIVDVVIGLLNPDVGSLVVDKERITDINRCSWQSLIGYVPQSIFLSDDSIAANIAFGLSKDLIDLEAVELAAKTANLHDFVVNDLEYGYSTIIGERGIRLSEGQRQRIGIARALYHKPQVLILDEATSALDNLTEQAVMDAISNLHHEVTIIMIAHRLSTVKECDQIFLLDRGKLIAMGSYNDLQKNSIDFQELSLGQL